MGFLLSLNLSHWIGSFSTIGLDAHLGFSQKGLREAFSLHLFISWRRELKESKGTNSQTELRVIFSGTKTKIINCWLEFQGEGTTSIYCAQKTRWSTASFIAAVQYSFQRGFPGQFGHVFPENIRHRFRGRNLAHFPRYRLSFEHSFRGPYGCI